MAQPNRTRRFGGAGKSAILGRRYSTTPGNCATGHPALAHQPDPGREIASRPKHRRVRHRRSNGASQRVETIPGIGVLGATAIVAMPHQDSTGGKQKLGPISKQGDQYLRRILIVGAISVLRRALQNPGKYPWLTQLLARRPFKVVAVALANKMARVAWALLAHGGTYRAPELAEAA
jgi:transposase